MVTPVGTVIAAEVPIRKAAHGVVSPGPPHTPSRASSGRVVMGPTLSRPVILAFPPGFKPPPFASFEFVPPRQHDTVPVAVRCKISPAKTLIAIGRVPKAET